MLAVYTTPICVQLCKPPVRGISLRAASWCLFLLLPGSLRAGPVQRGRQDGGAPLLIPHRCEPAFHKFNGKDRSGRTQRFFGRLTSLYLADAIRPVIGGQAKIPGAPGSALVCGHQPGLLSQDHGPDPLAQAELS